jgi:predicted DNA-binding transcriptional regulator AlpA
MPVQLLRFADLKKRGVAGSWAQLKRLQQDHDFPLGRMLSPNIRAWTDDEIDAWWKSCPVENTRALQGASLTRHERRQAANNADKADKAQP